MPRALQVLSASQRPAGATVVDTLILRHADRQGGPATLTGSRGTVIELALSEPRLLRTDDLLALDDGSLVEVVAAAEPLLEVRAPDLPSLARLAWALGGQHIPVQVFERKLRLPQDTATEAMLARWGLKGLPIEAPFQPEDEAAAAHDHHHHDHHAHGHAHAGHHHHGHAHHDHAQHHHDHGAACGCGHDHHAHDHHHDHGSHGHAGGKR